MRPNTSTKIQPQRIDNDNIKQSWTDFANDHKTVIHLALAVIVAAVGSFCVINSKKKENPLEPFKTNGSYTFEISTQGNEPETDKQSQINDLPKLDKQPEPNELHKKEELKRILINILSRQEENKVKPVGNLKTLPDLLENFEFKYDIDFFTKDLEGINFYKKDLEVSDYNVFDWSAFSVEDLIFIYFSDYTTANWHFYIKSYLKSCGYDVSLFIKFTK